MNASDYETILIIYFIISIAVAIVFIVMAANIGRMKRDIIDIRKIAIRYAKKDDVDLKAPEKKPNSNN